MPYFSRTSKTEATCISTSCSCRLLAPTEDGNGPWMVIADTVTPPQPSYFAVPGTDTYCFEIRRDSRDGELAGYSQNLADAAEAVGRDLVDRGAGFGTASV